MRIKDIEGLRSLSRDELLYIIGKMVGDCEYGKAEEIMWINYYLEERKDQPLFLNLKGENNLYHIRSYTPFGKDDLLEWAGDSSTVFGGANPECATKANGLRWVAVDGDCKL